MCSGTEEKFISNLKTLWKLSFDDSDAFIDLFFNTVYKKENMLTIENEEGTPVSMTYLYTFDVKIQGKKSRWMYLYALSTHPQYRNIGYAEQLINEAKNRAKIEEKTLFLVPGNEKLREYYKKRGFCDTFYRYKTQINKIHPPIGEYKLKKCENLTANEIASMYEMYNNYKEKQDNICFQDEKSIKFMLTDCGYEKMNVCQDENGFVIYQMQKNNEIKIVFISAENGMDMVSYICRSNGVEKCALSLSEQEMQTAQTKYEKKISYSREMYAMAYAFEKLNEKIRKGEIYPFANKLFN